MQLNINQFPAALAQRGRSLQGVVRTECGGILYPCMNHKATSCDVSVRLLWGEEDALTSIANKLGQSKAGVFRQAFYDFLSKHDPKAVKALIKARLAHAVDANTRQQLSSFTSLLIVGLVFVQSALGSDVQMRRPRSGRREFQIVNQQS